MSSEIGDIFDRKLFPHGMRRLYEAIGKKDAKREDKGRNAASLRENSADDICSNDGADSK